MEACWDEQENLPLDLHSPSRERDGDGKGSWLEADHQNGRGTPGENRGQELREKKHVVHFVDAISVGLEAMSPQNLTGLALLVDGVYGV